MRTDLNVCFSECLKTHRLKANLSQKALAVKSGRDRSFISMMERGFREPGLNTLMNLATAFGITGADFIADIEVRLRRKLGEKRRILAKSRQKKRQILESIEGS